MYKFERLEVYQLALEYVDSMYDLAKKLPRTEERNLHPQLIRAATSIVLNIAEGSTSQSDTEQRRFLGMALRSLIETVACQHLIQRRAYASKEEISKGYDFSQIVFAKLQAMRRSLKRNDKNHK
jgi:four helix bundle protein